MIPLDKDALEEIADWLDLSDAIMKDYANLIEQVRLVQIAGKGDIEIPGDPERMVELIRKTCSGNAMQNSIREWAENIDNALLECPFDCDACRD